MNLGDRAAQKLGVKPVVKAEKAEEEFLLKGDDAQYSGADFLSACIGKGMEYLASAGLSGMKKPETKTENGAGKVPASTMHDEVRSRYRWAFERLIKEGKLESAARMDALNDATRPLESFVRWIDSLSDEELMTAVTRTRIKERARLLANGKTPTDWKAEEFR